MSWKTISVVQARKRFVKQVVQDHETVAQACRIFHISRKTGHKWLRRFAGPDGVRDRPRRPRRVPGRTAKPWLEKIRRVRRRHRRWGAKKIRAYLRRKFPRQKVPAVRTITRWLARWKLSRRRRRRALAGPRLWLGELTEPVCSNHVWTVDFKGWFRTTDGRRVEPLTVRDLFSRYLLTVRLLPDQQWWRIRAIFVRLLRRHGPPRIIRVDNGFGSSGPAGFSRLSAWWTALGIKVEFMDPGHPEQNGGHEQMHREFKADLTAPASSQRWAQQRRTNRWIWDYNWVRPHEALEQSLPGERYRPGRPSEAAKLRPLCYRKRWAVRRVRSNGQIRWQGRLRFIGEAFVGLRVGLQPAGLGTSKVYLAQTLLGELRTNDIGGIRPASYVRKHPHRKAKV
jgi:putative transposase